MSSTNQSDVDTFDDDFDDEPYVPPTEEELKQMEERRKKSDKISAEIARRMLQGWGLLGDHCPQEGCFTPLLKEPKTAKRFCVNCNVYVLTEEEYEASQLASESQEPVKPTPASTTTISSNTSSLIGDTTTKSNVPASQSISAQYSNPTSRSAQTASTSDYPATSYQKTMRTTERDDSQATDEFRTVWNPEVLDGSKTADALREAMEVLTEQMKKMNSELKSANVSLDSTRVIISNLGQCAITLCDVKGAGEGFGLW